MPKLISLFCKAWGQAYSYLMSFVGLFYLLGLKKEQCKTCAAFYGGFCLRKSARRVMTDYSCDEYNKMMGGH